jgi:hypothetical protein
MSASPSSLFANEPVFPALPRDTASLSRISRWRRRALPSPSVLRFLHPWYLLRVSSVLLYFIVREVLSRWPSPPSGPALPPLEWSVTDASREVQMFLILAVLLMTKFRRSVSGEAYLVNCLRFAQLAVVFASFVVDVRLCIAMTSLYAVLLLVDPRPPQYNGPSNVHEVGLDFFQQCVDQNQQKAGENSNAGGPDDSAPNYIVSFTSSNVEACRFVESEFARASCHYGYPGSGVRFLRISVDRFPSLLHQFQILSPAEDRWAHELPTMLMFQRGKVLARLPQVGNKSVLLNETNMVRAFDLERRARVPPEAWTPKSNAAASATATSEPKKRK